MEIRISIFSLYIAAIFTIISCCIGTYELNLTLNGIISHYNINFLVNVIIFIVSYIVFNKTSK